MNRLKDKVAIITGGARGIGLVTAKTFAREGARVIIWDVDETRGREVVRQFSNEQLTVRFMPVDVTQFAKVARSVEAVHQAHQRIDILVNNAGITRDARLDKMNPEQWQKVIDVNLTGVFNCAKAVSGYMVEQNAGRILNASSVVGLYGNYGQSNYVATKAGVIGMTKVWARELGPKGITVNAVAPGFIRTEMIQTVPEKVIRRLEEKTPLRRIGEPQDIANAYLFLASDEAAYINGAVLSVDGGLTI